MYFNFHSGLTYSRKSRTARRSDVRRPSQLSLFIVHVAMAVGGLQVAAVLSASSV